MPSLGDLFGKGSAAEQLFVWNVVGQVVSALISPGVQALAQQVNDIAPTAQLSPAELATAVVRNYLDQPAAADSARRAGLENDKFATLVHLAGRAPAPGDLATALRRGIIPADGVGPDATSFAQGFAETDLGDKWAPVIKALAVQWPSPTAALDALLEGQIDEATAKELYQKFGGDLQYFDMLYNTQGTAPTPVQALEMANRGLIPWDGEGAGVVSFKQAFLEGPWRNKWEPVFRGLGEYLPPPRTITAMYHEGALTAQEATGYLVKHGLSAELAAKYVSGASGTKTATAKALTESQIIQLYELGVVTRDDAAALLKALKYSDHDLTLILELADLRRVLSALNSAVTRVHALYVGHKLDKTKSVQSLTDLGLSQPQVDAIMGRWDLEAAINVRALTESQIVAAYGYKIISQADAQTELEQIGYSPRDAWVLLSIKHKEALPDEPPPSRPDVPPLPAEGA